MRSRLFRILTLAIAAFVAPCAGRAQMTEEASPSNAAPHASSPNPKPKAETTRRSKPKPQPAPAEAAAPAPAASFVLPDPPTPVAQARQHGLDRCAPMLDAMSREALTTTYDVQSGWSVNAPAEHVFQSVAVLTRPGNIPPDGLAALIAAPLASGACDGVVLQVFPLAGDCQAAQRLLLVGGGKTIGPIVNARIMTDAGGRRLFLLPGYSNTCIAIAVDSRFAPP